MQKYFFLDSPEQLFLLKRGYPDIIPVIPLYFDNADINRIVAYLQRKSLNFAAVLGGGNETAKDFIRNSKLFKEVFLFNADDASTIRASGYEGKIFLFVSFRELSFPEFFRQHKIRPVVAGIENYEKAMSAQLDPVYFVSSKACVADFNQCVSREGFRQNFNKCDIRCREKAKEQVSGDFPASIKPCLVYPKDAKSVIYYSEQLIPDKINAGVVEPSILNRFWNYAQPIGKKIIKPGRKTGEMKFSFNLSGDDVKLFESGLLSCWAYSGAMYRGNWLKPLKEYVKDDSVLRVTLQERCEKLLLVHRYDETSKKMLKEARHFLYTMPESKVFLPLQPLEKLVDIKPKLRKRKKLTIIVDKAEYIPMFRSRDVERTVFLYSKNAVSKFYNNYLLIATALSPDDIALILDMPRLKGVVVTDAVMKDFFEAAFKGRRTVIEHPSMVSDSRQKPVYISFQQPVFTSFFVSQNKKDYRWPSLNLEMVNYKEHSVFYFRRKTIANTEGNELWADLVNVNEETARLIKTEADRILAEKPAEKPAGKPEKA